MEGNWICRLLGCAPPSRALVGDFDLWRSRLGKPKRMNKSSNIIATRDKIVIAGTKRCRRFKERSLYWVSYHTTNGCNWNDDVDMDMDFIIYEFGRSLKEPCCSFRRFRFNMFVAVQFAVCNACHCNTVTLEKKRTFSPTYCCYYYCC